MMQDQDENEGVALRFGRFVSNVQWRDISDTLQHDAKRSLVNFFGGAIGAACHPDIDALAAVLDAFSGPREVTVIGRAERLDVLSASTLNAIGANLLDYDDTHLHTVMHPTAPVAPPVLALAERHRHDRVRVELDASLPVGAARVIVRTRSGDTYEATVDHARGSLEKPLSDAEFEAKVYALASDSLPTTDIEQCLAMLWQLQNMTTIQPLMALVSG